MGALIKADESMKRKVCKQSELMRSVLVHVVSGFICALVCCYSYWFPWFYCFINHFMWIYLPTVWPVVFGPKCMFFVANVIVVVVVSEWRQTCGKTSNLHDDMYDEYVRRSRGPRRVLVYKKVERKPVAAVKKNYTKAIEIKKMEMAKDPIVVVEEEEKEELGEEFHESKDDNIVEANDNISEEKNEDEDASSECESVEFNNNNETKEAEGGCENKREEETRTMEDELNKRVEDFIARVNRRRWAEAEASSNWLICSA